jgi:glycosyltransferase involved in cell wall biosynthesis
MKVSIVLPAYNEARRIRNAVETVIQCMDKTGYEYEIIIAEDGSTDGTDRIALELASKYNNVKHLHSDERLGRGKALVNAFQHAEGDVLIYLDVDLSTDMNHLRELIDSIAVEGYDFATGSRLVKGSCTERPFKRDFASKGYNFLVRFLLKSKLYDHQCGFKAFRKAALMDVVKYVKDNHWFWDTEVLVLAQRFGYKVKEFPVRWKQGRDTKVRFGRDILYMFGQILRMWRDLQKHSRDGG